MRLSLLHILARLALDRSVTEPAIAWADAALTAGEDSSTICILAGLSPNAAREEVAPYLQRAARELGVRVPTREESVLILRLGLEREARNLAMAIAESRTSLIEGSVKLAGLSHEIGRDDEEMMELFGPFVAVSSETDHLPLADDRVHWNAAALREKDDEIRSYESSALPELIPACRALMARLDRNAERVATTFFGTFPVQ